MHNRYFNFIGFKFEVKLCLNVEIQFNLNYISVEKLVNFVVTTGRFWLNFATLKILRVEFQNIKLRSGLFSIVEELPNLFLD